MENEVQYKLHILTRTRYGQERNRTQCTSYTPHFCPFHLKISERKSGIITTKWALYLALWSLFSGTSKSIKLRKKKHYPPMPTHNTSSQFCKAHLFRPSWYLKMAGATRPKRRALQNWLLVVLWEKELTYCSDLPTMPETERNDTLLGLENPLM